MKEAQVLSKRLSAAVDDLIVRIEKLEVEEAKLNVEQVEYEAEITRLRKQIEKLADLYSVSSSIHAAEMVDYLRNLLEPSE